MMLAARVEGKDTCMHKSAYNFNFKFYTAFSPKDGKHVSHTGRRCAGHMRSQLYCNSSAKLFLASTSKPEPSTPPTCLPGMRVHSPMRSSTKRRQALVSG